MKKVFSGTILVAMLAAFLTPTLAVELPAYAADAGGFSITLWDGKKEILFCGQEEQLDIAPISMHNMLYLPLRAVVERCGGMVQYEPTERAAMVSLRNHDASPSASFAKFWVGKRQIRGADETLIDPAHGDRTQDFSPFLQDGIFYVPVTYFSYLGCEISMSRDGTRVTLAAFDNELRLGGVTIQSYLDEMSPAVLARFKPATTYEAHDYGGWYENVRALTDGQVLLYVGDIVWNPDEGKRSMIAEILLIGQDTATPRGLRLGDPVEKWEALYGNSYMELRFFIQSENGIITQIGLSSML